MCAITPGQRPQLPCTATTRGHCRTLEHTVLRFSDSATWLTLACARRGKGDSTQARSPPRADGSGPAAWTRYSSDPTSRSHSVVLAIMLSPLVGAVADPMKSVWRLSAAAALSTRILALS
jgi:hypothetical protein